MATCLKPAHLHLDEVYAAIGDLPEHIGGELALEGVREAAGGRADSVSLVVCNAARVVLRFDPVTSYVPEPCLKLTVKSVPPPGGSVLHDPAFLRLATLMTDLVLLPTWDSVLARLRENFSFREVKENKLLNQTRVTASDAAECELSVDRFLSFTRLEDVYKPRSVSMAGKIFRAVHLAYTSKCKHCCVCGRVLRSGETGPLPPTPNTCGNDLCSFVDCSHTAHVDLWSEAHCGYWFPWDFVLQAADAALTSNRRSVLLSTLPLPYHQLLGGGSSSSPDPTAPGAGGGGRRLRTPHWGGTLPSSASTAGRTTSTPFPATRRSVRSSCISPSCSSGRRRARRMSAYAG